MQHRLEKFTGNLFHILLHSKVIEQKYLMTAAQQQMETGQPLIEILFYSNVLSEELLVNTLASIMKLPILRLDHCTIDPKILKKFELDFLWRYQCLPFQWCGKYLLVLSAAPLTYQNLLYIEDLSRHEVLLYLGLYSEIKAYLQAYKTLEES
jgi:hypothetical protein